MLVTITGIDGCGKGTQLQHLAAFLQGQGRSVFVSKAYGDAEKELFALFIERATDEAVMFLFQAMHAEQRAKAARAQERGEIVLADRWDESYEAYHSQYGVLSHDTELRQRLNEVAFGGWRADVTILLRVPVAMAMERCRIRGADFFDLKGVQYHQSLADRLDELASELGWHVIDGSLPHKEVHQRIVDVVASQLP